VNRLVVSFTSYGQELVNFELMRKNHRYFPNNYLERLVYGDVSGSGDGGCVLLTTMEEEGRSGKLSDQSANSESFMGTHSTIIETLYLYSLYYTLSHP